MIEFTLDIRTPNDHSKRPARLAVVDPDGYEHSTIALADLGDAIAAALAARNIEAAAASNRAALVAGGHASLRAPEAAAPQSPQEGDQWHSGGSRFQIIDGKPTVVFDPPAGTTDPTEPTSDDWRDLRKVLNADPLVSERERLRMAIARILHLTAQVEELEGVDRRADLHADLNRRAHQALGGTLSGEGSSWHDIPERIMALRTAQGRMEAMIRRFVEVSRAYVKLRAAYPICDGGPRQVVTGDCANALFRAVDEAVHAAAGA